MDVCKSYLDQLIGYIGGKGKANLGVLQLPLFNLLVPEYKNCISFSSIQGIRGLNANVSKNLPERTVILLMYILKFYGEIKAESMICTLHDVCFIFMMHECSHG